MMEVSPLAGETNWMETFEFTKMRPGQFIYSPLAGETNWMETQHKNVSGGGRVYLTSPLAGETNWMETNY